MNNTQLYLTIGVPTLTVILAWVASRADLHREIDKLDRGLDNLQVEMIALRREIYSDMVPLHERMAKLKAKQA